MQVPEVKTKAFAQVWKNSLTCIACSSMILFSKKSHCRACGESICTSCLKTCSLPTYGLSSKQYPVCPHCHVDDYSHEWLSWSFGAQKNVPNIISGIIGVLFLYPKSRRTFAEFAFDGLHNFLQCAFLCKDVPPIDEIGKSIVYRQREAWIRFATSSLATAVALYRRNSLQPQLIATFCAKVRVALVITRLLAISPVDNPENAWDATRESLLNSNEDGAFLLCLLMEKRGSWKAVGDAFLERKWLPMAIFAFKMSDRQAFDESDLMLSLASQQTSAADEVFFTAAAALFHETADNIISLATTIKKADQPRWALDILCAGWNKWKDSVKKVKGHILMVECLEMLTPVECDDVLMSGYELLCELVEGQRVTVYRSKLQVHYTRIAAIAAQAQQEAAQMDILRNLRYHLTVGSSESFSLLLLKAFKEEDSEELRHVMGYQTRIYTDTRDRSKLPAPVRANLLLPEAILDIIQGRCLEGLRKLFDALLMSVGAGKDDYLKLVAEITSHPKTRTTFLTLWCDQLRNCSTVCDLLTSSWLADIGANLDNTRSSEFQFTRILSNNPELRALRMFERAIDSVFTRDGPFEAAMSCIDATMICGGQGACLNLLLKATRYLYHAASDDRYSPGNGYACVMVGSILLHVNAFQILDRQSPVMQGYFARQILFQQLAFLQKLYTLSSGGYIPPETYEMQTWAEATLQKLLSLYTGFPVICTSQNRAFDDLVTEIVFDELSDANMSKLESNLAGLVTYEQWTYWRFTGAWHCWLRNPLNDTLNEAIAQFRARKCQRDHDRRMSEEEPSPEQIEEDRSEEEVFLQNTATQRTKNAWEFLEVERGDSIIRYLQEKNWQWEHMSRLMNCMCVPRTPDGFIDPHQQLKPRNGYLFSSFDGFVVDRATGTVEFLLTESRRSGKPALFGWQEMKEIFKSGALAMNFSLDSIDPQCPYHPLQVLHFSPPAARGTTVLSCMFHTDYLLKFLTCGVEISCQPPFKQRSVREGFFRRLPQHIQAELSVIWNGQLGHGDQAHRFWIAAGNLPYSETSNENIFQIVYGNQAMCVKKHKLRRNANGEQVDDDGDEEEDLHNREFQFATSFTRHYSAIAGVFPEFAMLAEFSKMIEATKALLIQAEICKQNIEHINNQIDTKTREIESSLREQFGMMEFPQAGSQRINELIEDHVNATNRLNSYRLTSSQKEEIRTQARTEYQRQAREADEQLLSALTTQFKVNSDSVSNALRNKTFGVLARNIVNENSNGISTAQFSNLLSSLRREGFSVDGNIIESMNQSARSGWAVALASDFNCAWVPAVFRTRGFENEEGGVAGMYRVYGGVSLQANLCKQQILNPSPNSQHFTSTETLSAQRAVAAPFSTAARIDNQNRATQDFFARQRQVMDQITANRAAERHTNMLNTFTNQQASVNRGGHHQEQVRRYASSLENVAGAYWTPERHHSRKEARNGLAVLPEWSSMKYMAVSSIPPTAKVYRGPAAPQGIFSGGAVQYVIPDVWEQRSMAQSARVYKHEWSPRFFETWDQVK